MTSPSNKMPGINGPINLHRDELIELADQLKKQDPEVKDLGPVHIAALALTLARADESRDSQDGSVEIDGPDTAVDTQSLAADMARLALAAADKSESTIDSETIARLNKVTSDDDRRRVRDARVMADEAERRSKVEAHYAEIQAIESKPSYQATSGQKRTYSYDVSGNTRNGAWLVKCLNDLSTSDGAMGGVFSDEDSNTIAALVINQPAGLAFFNQLNEDLELLEAEHAALRKLGDRRQKGLIIALSKLRTAYDEGGLDQPDLLPAKRWYEDWTEYLDGLEVDEMVNETLDLGPFAECEVLDGEFFPRGSVELDDADFTADNITKDIETFIANSSGSYEVSKKRIENLIALLGYVKDVAREGASIQLLRSQNSRWHPMPWYGIRVISGEDDWIIFETPVKGNGTYVFDTPRWTILVQKSREQARKDDDVSRITHDEKKDPSLSRHLGQMKKSFDDRRGL